MLISICTGLGSVNSLLVDNKQMLRIWFNLLDKVLLLA